MSCSTIITGLSQWTLTTTTKISQVSGKSLPNQHRLTTRNLSLFGKPENTHSTVCNTTQKRTASNGKLTLTGHLMQFKLSKLWQTSSWRKPDNQRTLSLHTMSTKSTAFTTSNQQQLLSHSAEFTDSHKRLPPKLKLKRSS